MSRRKSGIYKITSPSGKVYIGQSIDINRRFKQYKRMVYTKGQPKLHRSFLKYGIDAHKFEILQEFPEKLLNDCERFYQELYDCVDNGLNCMYVDGNNMTGKHSEESKRKMSESTKGENHPFYGTKGANFGNKHKPETIELMKTLQVGEKHPNITIVLNQETGIYYYGVKEAADSLGFKYTKLYAWLSGQNKNKSTLKIV